MGKGTEGGAPARAQDDLYAHVNREWLDANPVPAAYGRWGTFEMLNDAALENTKICLEEAGDGDKGGAFLASGMRAAEQDSRAALAPTLKLAREFAAAAAAKDANALAVAIAEMHVFGVSSLFGVGDTPDKKNSEWSIVGVAQGGVALPDRDYYLSADPDRVALRAKYVAHVAKMLTLVGGEY